MIPQTNNYKNIEKSTVVFFKEEAEYKILRFQNNTDDTQYFLYPLNENFIHLYFCTQENCVVAFNMEHCAVNLNKDESSIIYFNDDKMNVLHTLPPKVELVGVLISISYFHSLFSTDGNFLFNFSNFNVGKPIIEQKETSAGIKVVLNQLFAKKLPDSLKPIYIKGKVFELLSLYFSSSSDLESDDCPYIANEETINKLKQVKDIIIQHMASPPSLEQLSKTVGLNIKKLKEGFKEFYGAPVFTFLFNYRMEVAKKLLIENEMNVNEIGAQVGYTTSSHFIAAFKKKHGITPKQFSKL
ncbi:MAG: AraC family transcriptional regulator [Flavobacteriaceae bacterium]|nr:MAG: AraC family transcriptional regulator [Flavobacteriaceae bacterium]